MGARCCRCFESPPEPWPAAQAYQQPWSGQAYQQPLGPNANQAFASAPAYSPTVPAVARAVPVPSASPSTSVPHHVAKEFVDAVHAEYLNGRNGFVGHFFARPEAQAYLHVLEPMEDDVRRSGDAARTIRDIAARLGVGYQAPRPAYAQPAYAQPAYAQPAYAQPVYAAQPASAVGPGYVASHYSRPDYHSSSGGRGDVMMAGGVGLAAGLAGGMLIENALDHRRHRHHRDFAFGGGTGYGPGFMEDRRVGPFGSDVAFTETHRHGFFGTEQVNESVMTDGFGDTEIRREIVDRDMFGRVQDVREEVVDRDMFGNTEVREYDDRWG